MGFATEPLRPTAWSALGWMGMEHSWQEEAPSWARGGQWTRASQPQQEEAGWWATAGSWEGVFSAIPVGIEYQGASPGMLISA